MRIPHAFLFAFVICGVAFAGEAVQWKVGEVAGQAELREGETMAGPKQIRNGADARVQFDSVNSVFRLGANSSAMVSGSGPGFALQRGSCLFADLPAEAPLIIGMGERKIDVMMGTGFAHRVDEDGQQRLIVGCIAGKTRVSFGGKTERLKAGELLVLDGNASPTRMDFDLARQVKSCALINDFKSALPNYGEVEKELARFAVLEKRGFIGGQRSERVAVSEENRSRQALEDGVRAVARVPVIPSTPSAGNPPTSGGVIDTGPGGRVDDDGGVVPVRPGGAGPPPGPPPGRGPRR